MNHEHTLRAWRQFITSQAGARYLARRVRVGAHALQGEYVRLQRWLAARAPLNHNRLA